MVDGLKFDMSIVKTTPEGIIEYPTFPSEERAPQLNTWEAMRFIAALAPSERRRFEELEAPRVQELHMITEWTKQQDIDSLSGHYASRALQSVRHLITSSKNADGTFIQNEKRYYFPLLISNHNNGTDLNWEREARFRRGIGLVVAQALDEPEFDFAPLQQEERVAPENRSVSVQFAGAAILNELTTSDKGTVFGSTYIIETGI